MLILSLIKKDILITKNQIYITLICFFAIPLFMNQFTGAYGEFGGFYSLYITVSYCVYLTFQAIFISEDKYKGAIYLTSTPFTRRSFVYARYVLIYSITAFSVIAYNLIGIITIRFGFRFTSITFSDVLHTVLFMSIIYGILLPLYYQFGFNAIKYPMMIVSVLLPLWGWLVFSKLLTSLGINIEQGLPASIPYSIVIAFVSVLLIALSIQISNKLFKVKDL